MDTSIIDFEGNGVQSVDVQPDIKTQADNVVTDVTNIDTNKLDGNDITSQDNTKQDADKTQQTDADKTQQASSTGGLEPGTNIEFDGAKYTVSDNGDIVDKDGNVFKEAKDVDEWLKSVQDDVPAEGTLAAVQAALNVDITDENGDLVEFADTPEGIKSYMDSVIELKSKEVQEATMNTFFASNPLVKQFIDYVSLTGSPQGFGELPDRSGIEIDKDNKAQQAAIIRMAAKEFGNKMFNDSYIKYLEDSGALYDQAVQMLEELQQKDEDLRKDIEEKAKAQRAQEAEDSKKYWEAIEKTIDGKVINGYKLPDNVTKEVNGKKVILTLNDFKSYVSRANVTNENGERITGYQRDLANLTDEQYRSKELLDAWLLFTGGTYKDLVDMAIKEKQVADLRLKSKEQRTSKTIKITKKPASNNVSDIILS